MRTQPVIRIDSKAWDAGFNAGERGPLKAINRCPYPPLTIESHSWHSGFIEGEAKRQGYSYSRGSANG